MKQGVKLCAADTQLASATLLPWVAQGGGTLALDKGVSLDGAEYDLVTEHGGRYPICVIRQSDIEAEFVSQELLRAVASAILRASESRK